VDAHTAHGAPFGSGADAAERRKLQVEPCRMYFVE